MTVALLAAIASVVGAGCRPDELSTTVAPQPNTIPATITGASMAPHLTGEHIQLTCSRCQVPFSIDALSVPRDHLATCPNCGCGEIPIDVDQAHPGTDVNVRPITIATNPTRQELTTQAPRWSITAWRHPVEDDTATIKRLVAYPGEQVAIRQGDLFIDGQRLRKDWPQQLATVIDVHRVIDQTVVACSPELESFARWHASSGWRQSGTQWNADCETAQDSPLVELTFTHYRTAPNLKPHREPVPVEDNDAFNQTTSRNMNATGELLVLAGVEHHDAELLQILIHNGEAWVEFELRFSARKIVVKLPGTEFAWERPLPKVSAEGEWQLGASTFDRQVTLSMDGVVVLREPLPEPTAMRVWHPIPSPIRIRSNGGSGLQLNHLFVGRDIFYLDPLGSSNDWTDDPEQAQGFFVLGDNAPVSRDSRHWIRSDLTLDHLIGIVEPLDRQSTSHIVH